MTSQSNISQGRGHDRLPNWNPKNGGMLISQPISSCLTNHSELCTSRLLNNQPRRISVYRLHRRPSFGFESSASSTPMTSGDPVDQSDRSPCTDSHISGWNFWGTETGPECLIGGEESVQRGGFWRGSLAPSSEKKNFAWSDVFGELWAAFF